MKLTVTARTGRIKSKVAKYRGLVGQEGDKFHDGSKVGNGERVPEDSNGYAHATVTFFLLSCPPSNVLSNIYLLFPYHYYYYSSSKYVPDFLSIFRFFELRIFGKLLSKNLFYDLIDLIRLP